MLSRCFHLVTHAEPGPERYECPACHRWVPRWRVAGSALLCFLCWLALLGVCRAERRFYEGRGVQPVSIPAGQPASWDKVVADTQGPYRMLNLECPLCGQEAVLATTRRTTNGQLLEFCTWEGCPSFGPVLHLAEPWTTPPITTQEYQRLLSRPPCCPGPGT